MYQLGFYKTSLYSEGINVTIKAYKFEISICFNSTIAKH